MRNEYTEYDTERVRQMEGSSEGLPTRNLAAEPPVSSAHTDSGRRDNNNLLGLALIAVGALLLVSRIAPLRGEFEAGMILLTIASCFLFFSFWKRIYALLIPGCILAGLSVGVTFADVSNGISVLWGLALGFLSIQFVGRALFNVHSNWPVYPAIPLFAVGVIVAIANLPGFFAASLIWLPLLLIAAGLYLGWGRTAH